jgi:hypothetical protein
MKVHLCFAIMFFQLAASLRQDAKSLRSRATAILDTPAGAKHKDGHDQRSLAAKKVTTTVAVKVVEPQQIVCPDGFTMDTFGKCCNSRVGETILNGVCCPAGVMTVASSNGSLSQWKCCAPGQIAALDSIGFSFCCPPDAVIASRDGKCCDSVAAANGLCEWYDPYLSP